MGEDCWSECYDLRISLFLSTPESGCLAGRHRSDAYGKLRTSQEEASLVAKLYARKRHEMRRESGPNI
jgi:hypothetical protein